MHRAYYEDDLMIACTWSSFNPAGGLGTLHPATVQSVGRLGTASLAHTSTNTPRINWRAEDIAGNSNFADEAIIIVPLLFT